MAIVESPPGIEAPSLKTKLKKPVFRKALDFLGANPLTRKIIRNMGPFLIDAGTEVIQFNLQSLDQIEQLWKPNSLLLIASGHQSHAEVVAILKTVQEVRARIPELGTVHIPISQTLENGVQSGISQTFYREVALSYFEQNGINPLYVVTANDRVKRGVVQTREEALQEGEKIKKPVKEENSAYFVLPEGTVEPGRHNKDGTIKGMVRVTSPFFRSVVEEARAHNRQIICIPIGVTGTYRLLSGEHIFLTWDGFKAIGRRLMRRKVMTLAEVTAGSPFIIGPEINSRELNDLIMREHIAPLIPEKERGYYKEKKDGKQTGAA